MAAVATTSVVGDRPSAEPWTRIWWWSSAVALALVAVLAVTGVLLWFGYRPTAEPALERVVHRLASGLLVPVSLLVAVSGVGARWQRGRRIPWPVAAFALAVGASFTGYLLPWDQLALWAVTAGERIDGVWFESPIRFYIVGGVEISPTTYRRWAVVHVVLGVALIGAVVPRRMRPR